MILVLFYLFAAISLWLGFLSLRSGIRFVRYLQEELKKDLTDFTPFATVFVPCRGVDEGLKENISALFDQDYPEFEIIFIADHAADPALAEIDRARRAFQKQTGPLVSTIIAGAATDSGQKVHNLRAAVGKAHPLSTVFIFTDTDARTSRFWLRALVSPLQEEKIGAATGYRWFVPLKGGLAAYLQSVWNASIASALGKDRHKNFCWGGSTAIRRGTFQRLQIGERWRGTISDDFTVSRLLHEANLEIKFVPYSLIPSFEDPTFGELFEFTTRQIKITRVYAPHLWRAVLIGSIIFAIAFFGGLALVLARALMGLSFLTPLLVLTLMFVLGAMKSHLRLRAVAQFISDKRMRRPAMTLAHVLLWPVASLLFLYNALAAISRRIEWRGISYELKSPAETVILSTETD